MAKTLTDMKKALATEKDKNVTLEQLQKAKEIYVEIAQECFKTKVWTTLNLALAILNKAFKNFVESNDLTEYRKSIFIGENGYNVVLALVTDKGEYDNVFSIKVKNEQFIMDLIDNHEFYLVSA